MRAARKHGQPEQCGEERHRQEKPRTITWAPGRGGSWDAYWWYNSQSQPKFMWPAAFPVVRSYLDQLVRGKGLASDRTTAIAAALDAAEQKSGAARAAALNAIAKQLDGDVSGARDADRVRMMSAAIKALAAVK